MFCRRPARLRLCGVVLALAYVGPAIGHAAPAPAADPRTHVYDVPEQAIAPLSEKVLARKGGWLAIGEGDTAHRFKGCAVFLNDKIVAVVRKDSPGVDVYSRQTRGLKLCARLRPVRQDGTNLERTSLAVKENTTSSVTLEVGLRSPSRKPCRIVYKLNIGEPFIKTTAAGSAAKLRVEAPCRFAVMPDFFGDDMLVDAAAISVGRAELPSENFLLHMTHGGEAIVMTVSESRDNDVGIALSKSTPRRIESSDISYGRKPHIWVAVLAERGIWHERAIRAADAGQVLNLDWRMPFAALWRIDWTAGDGLIDSWEMLLQGPEGKYVMQGWFGQDPAAGQSFGNPVLGSVAYPCWIEEDRRGFLPPLTKRRYVERGEVCNFEGPAIVYPIDRVTAAPFRTPIEKLTVVDVVRKTLGVGPCQYILDLEGQKRNSEGVATCYARDIINAIYKEGTQLRNGPMIEKQLSAAVAFIRNVRERIDDYMEFGRQTKAYLEQQKRLHPKQAKFCDELLLITKRLGQFYDSRKARIHTVEHAEQTARAFRRDLLKYTGADAYKKCSEQMRIFTGIGGAQDGLVASLRMIVKVIRQRAGIAMAVDPELKGIATEIRNRTQKILRNPTAYEAPQH